jgi:GAF domain-containing protein
MAAGWRALRRKRESGDEPDQTGDGKPRRQAPASLVPGVAPAPVQWMSTRETRKLSTKHAIREVNAMLARGAVRDALIYLNGESGHRFTSLYLFEGETLRNVEFYDRERPDLTRTEDIPIMASYCVFLRDGGGTFYTPDSLADTRLEGHPKRRQVRSYCGVPLVDDVGRVFGSVCHFDFEPVPFRPKDVELLEALAPALQRYGGAARPN